MSDDAEAKAASLAAALESVLMMLGSPQQNREPRDANAQMVIRTAKAVLQHHYPEAATSMVYWHDHDIDDGGVCRICKRQLRSL